MTRLDATAADQGQRADRFLAGRLTEFSRARLTQLIAQGHVLLDGGPFKPSLRLKGTESFTISVPEAVPAVPQAEALPLNIVFQDRELLVVNKEAGMVVHPGAGHTSGTLVNALLHHVDDLGGVGGELRPGIVHRLDKDTSGLLVIAKNEVSLRALQAAFKSREVKKTYVALVAGQPPDSGTFDTLYGRHPTQRLKFSGRVKAGKQAVTHFRTVKRYRDAARVEIELETGRTHQIRVHFAEAGFPLLSDALYGNRASKRPDVISRQALHAWKLAVAHPRTGRALSFTAPFPPDWKAAERALAAA